MKPTKIINNIEYYSANYIFRQWKGDKYTKKQIAQFCLLNSVKNAISFYDKKNGYKSFISYRGSGEMAGTWMCKEISVLFNNWLYKIPIHSYTRDETNFGDILNETFKGMIYFQHQTLFAPYIVDFYSKELNIVIEYDEKHHKYIKEYDLQREIYLKEKYNIKIIRHAQGENIGKTLNIILSLLINN
jgi:very-short-patch-repair endonuclease